MKTFILKVSLLNLVLLFIFLTGNAEAQWTRVFTTQIVRSMASLGSNVFAGADGGIYLSTNNGMNWTLKSTGVDASYMNCMVVSGGNIFAGTDNGVYLSTNNGESWNLKSSGLTDLNIACLAVIGTDIFAGINGGVFISTNNGNNWNSRNSGLETHVKGLAVSGSKLYAVAGGVKGVYISTNSGTNWIQTNSGITTNKAMLCIGANAANVIVGTIDSVFLSTNNGLSWANVNIGLSVERFMCSAFIGNNILIGTYLDGIFLSTNNGASWLKKNQGIESYPSKTSFALLVHGSNIYFGSGASGAGSGVGVWKRSYSELIQNNYTSTSGSNTLPADTYDNVTIGSTATSTNLNGSTINGTLTIQSGTGPITGSVTYGAGAIINYTGSSSYTTGSEIISTVPNITINNSAGVVLNSNTTVSTLLTLSSGKLLLGSNNLIIGSSGTVSGGSSASYIATTGTGGLKYSSVPAASNVIFPVGRSTYNPATLNYSGSIRDWTLAVKDSISSGILGNNPSAIIKREWNITPSSVAGISATITLQWNNSDEDAGFVRTNPLSIAHYDAGAGGNGWYPYASSNAVDGSEGSTSHKTTVSGLTSFSPYGIANDGPLPVDLLSFGSAINGRDVILSWQTSSEINNAGFGIERKEITEGGWISIGNVQGSGTVTSNKAYQFTDKKVNKGKYNYRLKQIDFNGNYVYFELSNVVNISSLNVFSLWQNYPNPFNPITKINYELPVNGDVMLNVFDISGKVIALLVRSKMNAGNYSVEFNGSKISSGIYFYKLELKGENGKYYSGIKKLILIK